MSLARPLLRDMAGDGLGEPLGHDRSSVWQRRTEGELPMDNAHLIGLSRQVALMRNLEVVANNIANVNTTGFKGDSAIFEEFLALPARETQSAGGLALPMSFVHDRGVWRDFTQGAVQA